jgi:imidazolonepropionase-like amidohydrolase
MRRSLVVLLLFIFAGMVDRRAVAAQPLAITHVNIIDTTGGPTQQDMVVLVTAGHIVRIAKANHASLPKGAQTVDGRGKYLIPGLWDMHVHTAFGKWLPSWTGKKISFPLFVANGVTGIRDMGSDLAVVKRWREQIAAGDLLGPRMVIAGPMLDGPTPRFPSSVSVATPSEGRRAVDDLKNAGVDFIKTQSLIPRDAYFAVVDEAKKREITFVGHVPDAIRAREASDAGQKSIEHLTGIFEACSTVEDEFLKGSKEPGRFVSTYSDAKAKNLMSILAKNQTWQVPTLVWEHGQWLIDRNNLSRDPLNRYAPAVWKDQTWPMFTSDILKDMDTDPLSVREKFTQLELQIVGAMRRIGVPFMAGTDTAAGVHVFPGFSLHQELEYFVRAGFTPLQALQTATLNPALFLGRSDMGIVRKGNVADLVLLDANPLVDIANTHRIRAVVLNGHYLSRSDLDYMLREAELSAASN